MGLEQSHGHIVYRCRLADPGGGLGVCPSWSRRGATCHSDPSAPDQVYRLNGQQGSEMIVWGGHGDFDLLGYYFNTGGRYDPGTDSWTATSTVNAPDGRYRHTAVWTGNEMIVWGGILYSNTSTSTGGRYCAPGPPATLGNISTRTFVQTGDNVMIGGFIVQGTGPKRVIIRAIGPELGAPPYNIPNALANPRLELHNSAGTLIGSNDDWQHTIIGGVIARSQVTDIQNSGHAPANPFESAIIADLPPGNYTAIVSGVNSTAGVGLVEVYDLSSNTASLLGNISTRSFVQTGDNVMIGGFIVQGTGAKKVIIRAIGPELGAPPYNIPSALANPTLELHNAAGALIASNDNWQTYSNWRDHQQQSGKRYSKQRACSRGRKGVGNHSRAATWQLHRDCARCKRHDRSRSR